MNNMIQMTLPPRLYQQVRHLITEGWFRNENDLLVEALRRFLDTHLPELMEKFIREDMEWGLHGKE
jgi:Arc/MetJ-type ribon-helix-helix transcriptional regulator